MTQLDLPQVSLARYLDLLRRHRWQLVPVSLLGLLVGALVAYLIPRYYVATTVLEFHGSMLDTDATDDPMAALVDSAQVTMPYATKDALQQLQWPEAAIEDVAERQAAEAEFRDRLEIIDLNPKRGRQTAHLRVTYRDTDATRAVDFTKALIDVWVEQQMTDLRVRIDEELRRLNAQLNASNDDLIAARLEKAEFERSWGINPLDVGPPGQDQGQSTLTRRREDLDAAVSQRKAEIETLELELQAARATRAGLQPTLPGPTQANVPEALGKAVAALQGRIANIDMALSAMSEAHKDRPARQRLRDRWQEELDRMVAKFGPTAADEVENPAYREAADEVRRLELRVQGLRGAQQADEARLAETDSEIAEIPFRRVDYQQLLDKEARAETAIRSLEQTLRSQRLQRGGLRTNDVFELLAPVQVPKRPTEPNITLVALAGLAVGLAVAIGLVLLIDILQSTFKTVDDVERVLALPVLGGLSYMTTDAELQAQSTRRRRVGIVVGVLVVLLLTVITIYYLDPTRLPPVVRDGLDVLLGAGEPTPTQ